MFLYVKLLSVLLLDNSTKEVGRVRSTLWIGFILVLLVTVSCAPRLVAVATGEKVVCSQCGTVIRQDIRQLKVPEKEISKYSVREIKELCSPCAAKAEEERKKAEEQQRNEEAKQAHQRQINAIAGTCVRRTGSGDVVVTLNSDGAGQWASPNAKIKWQSTSEGFSAKATYYEWETYWVKERWGYSMKNRQVLRTSSFSGTISADGRQLMLHGWGLTNGFRAGDSVTFDRLR